MDFLDIYMPISVQWPRIYSSSLALALLAVRFIPRIPIVMLLTIVFITLTKLRDWITSQHFCSGGQAFHREVQFVSVQA